MTAKKKLLIALCSFALVLVVAGASVGITLAALSGSVTSKFNISYTANNVNATLSAKYCTNGTAEAVGTMTALTASSEEELTFGPEEATGATKKFDDIDGITLAKATDYVYIAFHFKNNDEAKALSVTPTFVQSTVTNVAMHYLWVEDDKDTFPTESFESTFTNGAIGTAHSVTASKTHTLWIQVNVVSDIAAASFAGNFNFALTNAA